VACDGREVFVGDESVALVDGIVEGEVIVDLRTVDTQTDRRGIRTTGLLYQKSHIHNRAACSESTLTAPPGFVWLWLSLTGFIFEGSSMERWSWRIGLFVTVTVSFTG
jgi:hypothetical protein